MENEKEIYSLIQEYMQSDYSVQEANAFFTQLHAARGALFRGSLNARRGSLDIIAFPWGSEAAFR